MKLDSVPTALERLQDPNWSMRLVTRFGPALDWPKHAETRMFVRSPGFDSPTETRSWLFEQGVELHDGHVEQGPDGKWRGSGEVTGG